MTDDIKPVFAGEARLLRWNEGPNGRTVTLELDPDKGAQHPFMGLPIGQKSGQRMQLCAVLIDDNEEPVPPPQVGTKAAANHPAVKLQSPNADIPELKSKRPFESMKRAAQAGMKINDPEFQAWMRKHYAISYAANQDDPEVYDKILKADLEIASKTELDSNPEKGEAWSRLMDTFEVETKWGRS